MFHRHSPTMTMATAIPSPIPTIAPVDMLLLLEEADLPVDAFDTSLPLLAAPTRPPSVAGGWTVAVVVGRTEERVRGRVVMAVADDDVEEVEVSLVIVTTEVEIEVLDRLLAVVVPEEVEEDAVVSVEMEGGAEQTCLRP